MFNQLAAMVIGVTLFLGLGSGVNAQGEPLGGQPDRGAKQSVKDLGEQVATRERSRRCYRLCPHPHSTAFAWDC